MLFYFGLHPDCSEERECWPYNPSSENLIDRGSDAATQAEGRRDGAPLLAGKV